MDFDYSPQIVVPTELRTWLETNLPEEYYPERLRHLAKTLVSRSGSNGRRNCMGLAGSVFIGRKNTVAAVRR